VSAACSSSSPPPSSLLSLLPCPTVRPRVHAEYLERLAQGMAEADAEIARVLAEPSAEEAAAAQAAPSATELGLSEAEVAEHAAVEEQLAGQLAEQLASAAMAAALDGESIVRVVQCTRVCKSASFDAQRVYPKRVVSERPLLLSLHVLHECHRLPMRRPTRWLTVVRRRAKARVAQYQQA
jgi:hypothetical protein